MARPGRLDAMIEINDLDQEGVTKLVTLRLRDLLAEPIDWDAVYMAAEGYKPAFVTEFADRAIRYAMVRNNGKVDGTKIETEDLVYAAGDLRDQFDRMTGAKDRHEMPLLDVALQHALKPAVTRAVRETFYDDYLIPVDEVEPVNI